MKSTNDNLSSCRLLYEIAIWTVQNYVQKTYNTYRLNFYWTNALYVKFVLQNISTYNCKSELFVYISKTAFFDIKFYIFEISSNVRKCFIGE